MPFSATSHHPWCAIRTDSRKGAAVAALLEFKGYETYLPVYESVRQLSDRRVRTSAPLFPGYLFCRFDRTKQQLITTPGVISILGFQGQPEEIPESEISSIQTMLRSGLRVRSHEYLREGQTVTVTSGPLKGIHGVLTKDQDETKVVVSMNLLQRSVAVSVDRETVCRCT